MDKSRGQRLKAGSWKEIAWATAPATQKVACATGSILTEMPVSGRRYSLAPIPKLCGLVSKQDCKLVVVQGCGVTVTIGTKIIRMCVSALLAFAIAKLVFAPLFFVLWPGLYLGVALLKPPRREPRAGSTPTDRGEAIARGCRRKQAFPATTHHSYRRRRTCRVDSSICSPPVRCSGVGITKGGESPQHRAPRHDHG